MIQNGIFLAQNGDMVIRTVHGRTHQVSGAGIQTHVFPINMLLVQDCGNQMSVRRQHEASQFRINGHIAHAAGRQNLLKLLADTFTNGGNIAAGLFRTVVHTDAAGKIDESNMRTGGISQPCCQPEKLSGQTGIIFIGSGIGSEERMDAEMLGSQTHQAVDSARHLIFRHAVLGISGHIHDGIAKAEASARIEAQADSFRHITAGDLL